jgi:hypothetical protein
MGNAHQIGPTDERFEESNSPLLARERMKSKAKKISAKEI